MVRKAICAELGAANGRQALACTYPDGVKEPVERIREAGGSDAITEVTQEVLRRWAQIQTQR